MRPLAPTTTTTSSSSALGRPQLNAIASSKAKTELNPVSEESNAYPRKTFVRRFGVANKLQIKSMPRLINKNPLKPSQLVANPVSSSSHDARRINETMDITKGTAMNATKPVIDAKNGDSAVIAMDRSLIRSNTFVCDPPSTNDTITQSTSAAQQPNKERTSKRSLSPIPGEPMNSAKRKLMQLSTDNQNIMAANGMPLNSTPRRSISYSDARKANLTFFGSAKSVDFNEPHGDQVPAYTFDNVTFEQSQHFAPDAAKLGSGSSATMHGNRVFDLTQTVQQNDTFYPENRNATQKLDGNAAEHEPRKTEDATKVFSANDADANLTKTISGECLVNCASFIILYLYSRFFSGFFSHYATEKINAMNENA